MYAIGIGDRHGQKDEPATAFRRTVLAAPTSALNANDCYGQGPACRKQLSVPLVSIGGRETVKPIQEHSFTQAAAPVESGHSPGPTSGSDLIKTTSVPKEPLEKGGHVTLTEVSSTSQQLQPVPRIIIPDKENRRPSDAPVRSGVPQNSTTPTLIGIPGPVLNRVSMSTRKPRPLGTGMGKPLRAGAVDTTQADILTPTDQLSQPTEKEVFPSVESVPGSHAGISSDIKVPVPTFPEAANVVNFNAGVVSNDAKTPPEIPRENVSVPTSDLLYLEKAAPRSHGGRERTEAPVISAEGVSASSLTHVSQEPVLELSNNTHISKSLVALPNTQTNVRVSVPEMVDHFTATVFSKRNLLLVNQKPYYRLGIIGRGGSSKVFRVITPDGRIFAIKRVHLHGVDAVTIQGYLNEICLLEKLSSCESIIKLVDHENNQQERILLVVMECGEIDLAQVLQKQTLNMNFIRVYWEQMLRAVFAIHEQRVVHSDLKPANFLFVRGSLKLIDFGIAKAIQNDTTNIHRDHQVGTINYMSPEAILDTNGASSDGPNRTQCMKIGRASDVWSLGCILYQMVYGKSPFAQFTNMIQKLQKIIDPNFVINYPTVDNLVLVDVLKGCLQRDPRRRYTIPQLLEHEFLHPDKMIITMLNQLNTVK